MAVHRMGLRHPDSDKGGYSRVDIHDGPYLRADFALRNREQLLRCSDIRGLIRKFTDRVPTANRAVSIRGQSYICRAVSICGPFFISEAVPTFGSSFRRSPRDDERHADSTLELRAFLAPQRCG